MCPGNEERHEAKEKVAGQGVSAERLRSGGGFTHAQGQEGRCPDSDEHTTTRSLSVRPVERQPRPRYGELCADARASLQSVYINCFSAAGPIYSPSMHCSNYRGLEQKNAPHALAISRTVLCMCSCMSFVSSSWFYCAASHSPCVRNLIPSRPPVSSGFL